MKRRKGQGLGNYKFGTTFQRNDKSTEVLKSKQYKVCWKKFAAALISTLQIIDPALNLIEINRKNNSESNSSNRIMGN